MTTETVVARPRTRLRKFGRFLLFAGASIVALYCVGRLMWRFSGSNQWELAQEGNGARVYTLKEPGTDLKQIKGVVRAHTTLNRAVAWLQDPSTCGDAGCKDPRTIQRVDDQLQYVSMHFNMPGSFEKREFVMRVHFHQIPATKEVWVEYAAAPDKAPPNSCCFRVTGMNNTWRLTPLGNGEVEIEYTMNMDWGGVFPDVLSNAVRPRYMYKQLLKLEGYMNREKYREARFSFIQEDTTGAPVAVTANNLNVAGTDSPKAH